MNPNKARLSKSILEMKFMKRTKDKVEKELFQEEGEEYFGKVKTERMKNDSSRFVIEPSYVFCEKLIDGRLSYQGMNPQIEKLMELEQNNERMANELRKETDVSDEQMVNHWKGLNTNLKNEQKFQISKQRNTKDGEPIEKKWKFLKPQD